MRKGNLFNDHLGWLVLGALFLLVVLFMLWKNSDGLIGIVEGMFS